MFHKLLTKLELLNQQLWFIPALICLVYIALTVGFYSLEASLFPEVTLPGFFFNGGAGDSKSLAISLLSAMITMATLVVSITMVVLSLAASQLGPRLIKTFIADKKTQLFFGQFFGAVFASFVLTLILHDVTLKDSSPQVTISAVFFLCFVNLFVLLGFVSYLTHQIMADTIIAKVAQSLEASILRLTAEQAFPQKTPENAPLDWPDDFKHYHREVFFKTSGYVQYIDYSRLLALAEQHNLRVKLAFKPGHYIVSGENGLLLYPESAWTRALEEELTACVLQGNNRTALQDVEYSVRHLVEIALRALSPGINDPFTAITVLDYLSANLTLFYSRYKPPEWLADKQGELRVQILRTDEAELIFQGFDEIRQAAEGKKNVLHHMLKKLAILSYLSEEGTKTTGLLEQAKAIDWMLSRLPRTEPDLAVMRQESDVLVKKLEAVT